VGSEEVERPENELHGDKDLRLYIQAVASSAMAAFAQARQDLHITEHTVDESPDRVNSKQLEL
jgi:hypothetical protein